MFKNGRKERVGVHILVAQEFVDGWFEGAEVNHKDLNKKICPLEEIGNGSVTPCKIPKIIYLINFINTLLISK